MKRKYLLAALIVLMTTTSASCVPGSNDSTELPEPVSPTTENITDDSAVQEKPDSQISDHDYYPDKQQFTYGIFDPSGRSIVGSKEPQIIPAKYIERAYAYSSGKPQTAYHFESTATHEQVTVMITALIADEIKLTSGEVYKIISEFYPGWPRTYGLIISQDGDLIFAGLSDWQLDGRINIDDAYFPISNQPITVKQARVLTDHYFERRLGESICRTTNTEMVFSCNGKNITLHQGESAMLGDYDVNLRVAREIQWVLPPTDAGQNGISYTITKVSESKPSDTELASETVNFPDPALDSAIRQAIGKNTGEITRFGLIGLVNLNAPSLKISSISGLEKCFALRWLSLYSNQIEDISPLSELPNLHHLKLNDNQISDISPLANNLEFRNGQLYISCLLYTSDAADE